MKKTISILLLLVMSVSIFPGVFATEYIDIDGHWAEQAINQWSDKNIINGYNGSFKPDDSITRGEMAVILDRIMKFELLSDNNFTDLDNNFYTSAILKANYAGVILGSDNMIRPNDDITLQEVSAIICRALEIPAESGFITPFKDDKEISDWARDYICAMVLSGYLQGADGYLNPQKAVSRAQVITILNNIYTSGQDVLVEKLDGKKPMPSPTTEDTIAPLPEPSETPFPSELPSPSLSASSESAGGGSSGETSPNQNPTPTPIPEDNGIEIKTTLTDGAVQKGSRKTFDVWATDKDGSKIESSVTLNGDAVDINWDDNTKTSFTMNFTKEGENIVEVIATDTEGKTKSIIYYITYQKAQPEDVIGSCVWSFEAFTIGCGYIIAPQRVDIIEGENAGMMLDRIIKQAGFDYEKTGTLASNFYLSAIIDAENQLNLTPQIPEVLEIHLQNDMNYYDPTEFMEGRLGEFDFSNGSGWMYSLNNIFPNVGFADSYLSDGDVVRVQYTLAYGMDNGGYGSLGAGDEESMYFKMPDRDAVTIAIADKGIENCPEDALAFIFKVDATQTEIDSALSKLR
ncbi:MAG: S-layer homology domain-containing protein [Firmicutes bacterium]|nr:S-layer homology domain-containing protein [Bacillota bacterium]